jgi:hypothetical protein
MNIAQALKTKNRLVGEMNKQLSFVEKHNVSSRRAGTPVATRPAAVTPANISEAFATYLDLAQKLIDTKTAIQTASSPIAGKLVALAETKAMLAKVNAIPVREDVVTESGYGKESYEVEYTSVITEKMQIAKSEELQGLINQLQDEIDAFNATTQV